MTSLQTFAETGEPSWAEDQRITQWWVDAKAHAVSEYSGDPLRQTRHTLGRMWWERHPAEVVDRSPAADVVAGPQPCGSWDCWRLSGFLKRGGDAALKPEFRSDACSACAAVGIRSVRVTRRA